MIVAPNRLRELTRYVEGGRASCWRTSLAGMEDDLAIVVWSADLACVERASYLEAGFPESPLNREPL